MRRIIGKRITIGIVIGLSGALIYFPFWIEHQAPRLLRATGFETGSFDLRKLSFTACDLANLNLGSSDQTALHIDSIRVDYRLPDLFKQRVKRITVSGVELRATLTDGKLELPGINLEETRKRADKKTEPSGTTPSLPQIDCLEITRSTLILTVEGKHHRIRFEGTLHTVPTQLDAILTLYPDRPENRIILSFTQTPEQQQITASIEQPNDPAGAVLLSGNPYLTLTREATGYLIDGGNLQITSPFPCSLPKSSLKGRLIQESDAWNLNLALTPYIPPGAHPAISLGTNNLPAINAQATCDADGNWTLSTRLDGKTDISYIHSGLQTLVSGSLDTLSLAGKGNASQSELTLNGLLSNLSGTNSAGRFSVKHCSLSTRLDLITTAPLALQALLHLQTGPIRCGDMATQGISLSVPFSYPLSGSSTEANLSNGFFCVTAPKFKNIPLGNLESTIRQHGSSYSFSGFHEGLIPHFRLNYNGTAGLNTAQQLYAAFQYAVAEPKNPVTIDLNQFMPALDPVTLTAQLDLHGTLSFTNGTLTGALHQSLRDGQITYPKHRISLSGLNTEVLIDEPLALRSRADQSLIFADLQIGDLRVSQGDLRFQLESPTRLFLEKSRVSWCGGHVYTHPMRIDSRSPDLDMILFCDRLKLVELMDQLNIANGEGEGTLNGRLPLKLTGGNIHFSDGILFSEPGKSGHIQFPQAETLIPSQSGPQLIAQESLKNFHYDWAKIALNSQHDELHMILDLFGKPEGEVQLFYDNGTFTRTPSTDTQRVKIEEKFGITLNFNIPLNQMLGYGKRAQEWIK